MNNTDTKKQSLKQSQSSPLLSSLKIGNIVTIAWEQNDVENIDGFHILQEGTFVSINRVGTIVDFAHDKIIICWSFVYDPHQPQITVLNKQLLRHSLHGTSWWRGVYTIPDHGMDDLTRYGIIPTVFHYSDYDKINANMQILLV